MCLKDVIEEEYILLHKTESALIVNLKMTGYKTDVEKNHTLDIQKKLANIFIIKIMNQETGLDNFIILDLQKSLIKA